MGAVCALLSTEIIDDIYLLILDSPFSSLKILCQEISKKNLYLPKIIFDFAWHIIKNKIKKIVNFDLDSLELIKVAKNCIIPSFIFCGSEDELVDSSHSKKIFNSLNTSDKDFLLVEGGHNTKRPPQIMEKISKFILERMQVKSIKFYYFNYFK